MLSRHFLRAKVLQAVYAAQASGMDTVTAEKNLRHHIIRLNDLGTTQQSALVHILDIATRMNEESHRKFHAKEEDFSLSQRLMENQFLNRLADNYDFRNHNEASGVDWSDLEIEFRSMYATFVKSKEFKNYIQKETTFGNDKTLALKAFKFLMNEEKLRENLYQRSLLWEDDFDQIAQYNYTLLRSFDERLDESTVIPLMCDLRYTMDVEAMEFACQLLMNTMRHGEDVVGIIRDHLQGWDYERVAPMDVLLMKMAVMELTECPTIPERVTVDEYIELSKEFSTNRSRLFINGILDRMILRLRKEGRIQKYGRGLYVPPQDRSSDNVNDNEEVLQ